MRSYVLSLQENASSLRIIATTAKEKQIYNNICNILDELNLELAQEYDGSIVVDWQKFDLG